MFELLDPRTLADRLRGLLADPQPSPTTQAEIKRSLDSLAAGNYARHVPRGSRTWDGVATLKKVRGETGECVHEFSRPVHITGIVITLDGDPASTDPELTLDALELSLAWRAEVPDTEGQALDSSIGELAGDYVSARSLITDARIYERTLDGGAPKARWRARVRRGANIYRDTIVSVAFIGEYI